MFALRFDKGIEVGNSNFSTEYWLQQGHSSIDIQKEAVAWTCLTESITSEVSLVRIFKTMSPSVSWKLLLTWIMPKSLEQQRWNERFNNFGMSKGEDPNCAN